MNVKEAKALLAQYIASLKYKIDMIQLDRTTFKRRDPDGAKRLQAMKECYLACGIYFMNLDGFLMRKEWNDNSVLPAYYQKLIEGLQEKMAKLRVVAVVSPPHPDLTYILFDEYNPMREAVEAQLARARLMAQPTASPTANLRQVRSVQTTPTLMGFLNRMIRLARGLEYTMSRCAERSDTQLQWEAAWIEAELYVSVMRNFISGGWLKDNDPATEFVLYADLKGLVEGLIVKGVLTVDSSEEHLSLENKAQIEHCEKALKRLNDLASDAEIKSYEAGDDTELEDKYDALIGVYRSLTMRLSRRLNDLTVESSVRQTSLNNFS